MLRSSSNRREFFHSMAALATAGAATPYWFTAADVRAGSSESKNDRLRIGAIGVGLRGAWVARQAARFGDVVAVCDVDRGRAENAANNAGIGKEKAAIYQDYRRLLDRKDIDVVINGTPDHWHTAVNIDACRSGRDVYTEKPLTLTINEGTVLSKVVEETGRIVQVGAQQRSGKCFQTAVELVRNGRIGKLRQIWVAVRYYSSKGGPFGRRPIPEQFDWDMYQGQAPSRDFCPQRTHTSFRWWHEYAGGVVTDWGNHHMDIAHWGMDCELSGPVSVDARGIFPNSSGDNYYNTADRFFSRMSYGNGVEVLFFTAMNDRRLAGDVEEHESMSSRQAELLFGSDTPAEIRGLCRHGITFIGDCGRIHVNPEDGASGKAVDELKERPLPANAWRAYASDDHMGNFFNCVKTRRQPCATVQVEHRTVTACHLTNLSIRLKRKLVWNPNTQRIVGDDEADAYRKREPREVGKRNRDGLNAGCF